MIGWRRKAIDMGQHFANYAGQDGVDDAVAAELEAAGIEVHRFPNPLDGEVPTGVFGTLRGWKFRRAWRYWVAEGPGIPPDFADELYESHGQEARVAGDCGCRSPRFWHKGFASGMYHVDTQEGLNALAETIRRVSRRNGVVMRGIGDPRHMMSHKCEACGHEFDIRRHDTNFVNHGLERVPGTALNMFYVRGMNREYAACPECGQIESQVSAESRDQAQSGVI